MNNKTHFKVSLLPYLLVLPQLAITVIFFIWPAVQALSQSVEAEGPFGLHSTFVGLQNFVALFTESNYLTALGVTVIFSIAVTVLTMAAGLFFAVLANRAARMRRIYSSFLIWPYAVAPAVAGILFRFMFDPAIGIFPYLMEKIGIHWNYTVNGGQALFLVIIIAAWQQLSYNFLFYLASLQSVPQSLIESAALDGAGPFRRFWHIVFPLLSPVTFFLVVINLMYAFFDTFGIIQIVTQGGPASATTTLVYKVYNDGFVGLNFGSSAAQSVILIVIISLLTVLQFRFFEKKVHYS
jgi:sn-glycerol 3-phosphate transport system permease protein